MRLGKIGEFGKLASLAKEFKRLQDAYDLGYSDHERGFAETSPSKQFHGEELIMYLSGRLDAKELKPRQNILKEVQKGRNLRKG